MQGKNPMKIQSMDTSNIVSAAPLLLPSFLLSAFFFLQRIYTYFNLSGIIWLLIFFQRTILSSLLFFLSLLPSFFTFILRLLHRSPSGSLDIDPYSSSPPTSSETDDSGIARTLAQLLFIVTDIPVSSRKYDLIRSLAERLIDDNHLVGFEILRDLNRRVLSAAFSRTLARLQSAAGVPESVGRRPASSLRGAAMWSLVWVLEKARWVAEAATRRMGLCNRAEQSPEKLAAELLWMTEKMASCGTVEEAMCRWAAASGLASSSLTAEPRLQGALVRISAFLMKEAKGVVEGGGVEEEEVEGRREKVTGLLAGWLPLLCHASNGKDEPVLSVGEKGRVEGAVMEVVGMLRMEQQERVLSLWLHNFTYASSSDWPDLRPAYARWCAASRKLVILR